MQRRTSIGAVVLGTIGLLLLPSTQAATDAQDGLAQIAAVDILERPETTVSRLAAEPPRGIRSHGKGAARIERTVDDGPAEPRPRVSTSRGPGGGSVTNKISGVPMVGGVSVFTVSPDGTIAVYIADQETTNLFELYSTPVDGSAAPTKISSGLIFGPGELGVRSFQISPDSGQVVFLADSNVAGQDDIFSVPIDGSAAAAQLNAATQRPVTAFGISPDSAAAIFFGVDSVFGSGRVELYGATIGAAGSANQLSDVSQNNAQGNVTSALFSPDGSRVIYSGDGSSDENFQWYSVATGAAAPGTDVQLSSALGSVSFAAVSPDSGTVVYIGDDVVIGRFDVYSIGIAGGAKTQLSPAMVGDGARDIEISQDGSRVGYLADQNTAGVVEVYSAMIGVAGSGSRLNTPMGGTQLADTLNLSPDGGTVVYEADQDTPGTYELFRVPIDASAGPDTLHGLTAPDNAGFFVGLGTPVIGMRAVYPVFAATLDLFSVPYDGSQSFVQINEPLPVGDKLFGVYLPATTKRLLAYGIGAAAGSTTEEVFAAPIRPDLPVEQINVTAAPGSIGVLTFEVSSDEAYGVYAQDQDTSGTVELYARQLDSDTDGVINTTDNCPFIANLTQDPIPFGQTVLATSGTTFGWADAVDLRYVRGPLDQVGAYATDASGTLTEASSFSDATVPPPGSGLYYVFGADCEGRSYQTSPGAEPGRDLAFP